MLRYQFSIEPDPKPEMNPKTGETNKVTINTIPHVHGQDHTKEIVNAKHSSLTIIKHIRELLMPLKTNQTLIAEIRIHIKITNNCQLLRRR